MRIKKSVTIFALILFIFLSMSGFLIITYINSQEKLANSENTSSDNDGVTVTVSPSPAKEGFEHTWINYSNSFNFILFIKDANETNTDAMMVINCDTDNSRISVMSIPRDIVYETLTRKNVNGEFIKVKINSVYQTEVNKVLEAGLPRKTGVKNAVSKFEEFFGIDIQHYIVLDLAVFRDIIDQMGGIDFYVPASLDYDDPNQDLHIHFEKGMQHLNGQQAEELLRYRSPNDNLYTEELNAAYPGQGSDIDRIGMQQSFLMEMVKQKGNILYFTKIINIAESVYENIETDFDLNAILDLIKYIPAFESDDITWHVMPGKVVGYDYVFNPEETRTLINSSFNTGDN